MDSLKSELKRRPKTLLLIATAGTVCLLVTAALSLVFVSQSQPTSSSSLDLGGKENNLSASTNGPSIWSPPLPTTPPTSLRASVQPSLASSDIPTSVLTENPSSQPSSLLSVNPTSVPTIEPSYLPSLSLSFNTTMEPSTAPFSYIPGDLSSNTQLGLLLSTGLDAREIATSGERVRYELTGELSIMRFHRRPDFGATYSDARAWNLGGWIYVSNSEIFPDEGMNRGGVGALTFDRNGDVVDYKMILEGTTANCGGGRTPWGSWISCEEYGRGKNWQVDPAGEQQAMPITLGNEGGNFESFAFDARHSHYFVTEDSEYGPLRRFIPEFTNDDNPWMSLHGSGTTDYLRLLPDSDHQGTYEWTNDKNSAGQNAKAFYPNSEGIDVVGNELFFVSKVTFTMFVVDLDAGTYTSHTTRRGVFDGQPDQIQRIIQGNSAAGANNNELLYFTEDGGSRAGVHARDRDGRFFTILESPSFKGDETTGLAFSPDAKHMYVAYQNNGKLFDITRQDGLRFDAKTLNIKYHDVNAK